MINLECSNEELIKEIDMLKLQNVHLKQELAFYKVGNQIKDRKNMDITYLESIIEGIPSALVIFDVDEKFTYMNNRAKELYGSNESGFSLDTHLIEMEAQWPCGTQYPNEKIHAAQSLNHGENIHSKEMLMEKADGSKVPVIVSAAHLFDSRGKLSSVVAIFEDITKMKKVEKSLCNSEELKKTILENSHENIYMFDIKQRKYASVNPSFLECVGLTKEEMYNISFDEIYSLLHPDDYKDAMERYKLLATGIETLSNLENRWVGKDGKYHWFSERCKVIQDENGQPQAIVGIARDITERKEYEERLKKGEEKYRYLFNSIDEAFAIIEVIFDDENKGVDFKYIEVNPAYEKIMGIINRNVLGKTAKELKFEFENLWYETYGKVALTGEAMRFVNEVKSLNIWRDVFVFKIDLDKDSKVGVLFKDITGDVLYKHKIEEVTKMQDELYVNVSHELKTPLNVIFSANQLMDMYLNWELSEDNRKQLIHYNNNIKQNCYRLTKLINNIVDLSKGNSGLLELKLVNVNIVDVVENIVQSIAGYIKSRDLKITFDTNVEERIIACDTDKIERIVLNLISNAIKFSKPNSEIIVNVISKEETVEITVKDSGIGIEKSNLDKIFDRFYQVDKSFTRNAEGTGIGLCLVRSLIELHGGRISVESEVNIGSVFKVELPVSTIEKGDVIDRTKSMGDKIEIIKIEFSDIYSIN